MGNKIMHYEKDTINTFYDQHTVAEQYIKSRFTKPLGLTLHRIQVETINQAIKQYNAKNILDIACGPARLTAEITGFEKGVAIDTSDEMLSLAKQRVPETYSWQFVNGNAFNLRIEGQFDLIYSFRFIRHFRLEDRKRLYTNARSLLTQSGIFIFDAVHYDKPRLVRYLENKGQTQIYDKIYPEQHDLITELDEAAFEVLEMKEVVRHYYMQAVISRVTHLLRLNAIGENMIAILENLKCSRPLEWIVICRKR